MRDGAYRLVYGRFVHDPPLTQRSATALARAIREGEVSSREVVDAHIEMCKRYQPRTGAIAVERFDAARREADAADARIATGGEGELPPLLGVPCTIKESFAVKGMPNCAGLLARRDHRAETTAPTVQRLIDAGAIPLGLTNISELTLWIESDNRVYGRSSTPYDSSRAAGGSSGGEGAAVGSGASPFGLGSDIGGSIRIPAFFCGVFGHKPSNGLVPHTGSYPVPHGESKRLLGFGPLARRAEDLMPVLRILSGPDGADPLVTGDPQLGDPASVSLEGLRVLISESAFVQPIKRELLAARERAAGALAAAGARLERIRLPKMRRAGEAYLAALSDAGNASLAEILEEEGAEPLTVRSALRRGGPHTMPLKVLALLEQANRLSSPRRAQQGDRVGTRVCARDRGDDRRRRSPAPAARERRAAARAYLRSPVCVPADGRLQPRRRPRHAGARSVSDPAGSHSVCRSRRHPGAITSRSPSRWSSSASSAAGFRRTRNAGRPSLARGPGRA